MQAPFVVLDLFVYAYFVHCLLPSSYLQTSDWSFFSLTLQCCWMKWIHQGMVHCHALNSLHYPDAHLSDSKSIYEMPVAPSWTDTLVSSHLPFHNWKRTQSLLEHEETSTPSLGKHNWPTTDFGDFDFAFDWDNLPWLDLPNTCNIRSTNPSGSHILRMPEAMRSVDTSSDLQSATNELVFDFFKLYTLENSSLDSLTPSPRSSSPLPPGQTIGLHSVVEVLWELHDESHAECLALQEQMDAKKGTYVAYPWH